MTTPALLWLRRDLRLDDHRALAAAIAHGGAAIPVFILDPLTESWGAAARWRLGRSLTALDAALRAKGSRLILRRGEALPTLRALVAETGAGAVVWSRLYDAPSIARDAEAKAALRADGVAAQSFPGHLLFEPWEAKTGAGGFYKVYTPFWRALRDRDPGAPIAAPDALPAPDAWPASDPLESWRLDADMRRGAAVLASRVEAGEAAAQARLAAFLRERVGDYAAARDRMDLPGGSGLSPHLALGELSARRVWAAAQAVLAATGGAGPETFLKELVWRDFAWSLLHHTPHLADANWREGWDAFPWRGDNDDAEAWRRGMTGEPVVDAAMREMQATGVMHNRARMLVASYLTKHLLTDWRIGEAWFRDHLIDWDPASNAMGWQWAAGTGPDAAPYFRIFNPATQAEKFDPQGAYRRRWVAELSRDPGPDALAFFEAAPESWGLSPRRPYPKALIDLKTGRQRALDAYKSLGAAA